MPVIVGDLVTFVVSYETRRVYGIVVKIVRDMIDIVVTSPVDWHNITFVAHIVGDKCYAFDGNTHAYDAVVSRLTGAP